MCFFFPTLPPYVVGCYPFLPLTRHVVLLELLVRLPLSQGRQQPVQGPLRLCQLLPSALLADLRGLPSSHSRGMGSCHQQVGSAALGLSFSWGALPLARSPNTLQALYIAFLHRSIGTRQVYAWRRRSTAQQEPGSPAARPPSYAAWPPAPQRLGQWPQSLPACGERQKHPPHGLPPGLDVARKAGPTEPGSTPPFR